MPSATTLLPDIDLDRLSSRGLSYDEMKAIISDFTPIQISIVELVHDPEPDIKFVSCNEALAYEFDTPVSVLEGKRVIQDVKIPRAVLDRDFFPKFAEAKLNVISHFLFTEVPYVVGIKVRTKALKSCTIRHIGRDFFCMSVFDATPLIAAIEEEHCATDKCSRGTDTSLDSFVQEPITPMPSASSAVTKESWRSHSLNTLTQDLKYAENKFKALADAEIFGLGLSDRLGTIYSANSSYFSLLGYEKCKWESGDLNWAEENSRSQEHQDVDDKLIADLEKYGKTAPYERSVILPNGEERTALMFVISLDPPKAKDPKTLCLVVLVDITAQKQAQKEIHKAKEAAQQANALKTAFLSTVSHEIRSPLSATINLLELMRESISGGTSLQGSPHPSSLSPPVASSSRHLSHLHHDILGTALSSSRSLLTLLNDILDVSKFEATGKLEFHLSEFSVQKTVEEALIAVGENANAKGIEILVRVDEPAVSGAPKRIPSLLYGDSSRLKQVLVNLISNAIKFSHKCGKISVEVSNISDETQQQRQQQQKSTTLKFAVQDCGIGISEEDQLKIFQPFVQLDNSAARKYEGTGLGLAICQKIVEMMNGHISVRSTVGKGTVFEFTAEFGVVEQPRHDELESHLPPVVTEPTSVYVLALPSLEEPVGIEEKQTSCCGSEEVDTCGSDSDSDDDAASKLEERNDRQQRLLLMTKYMGFSTSAIDQSQEFQTLVDEYPALQAYSEFSNLILIVDVPSCSCSGAVQQAQYLLKDLFKTAFGVSASSITDAKQKLARVLNISVILVSTIAIQQKIFSIFSALDLVDHSNDGNEYPCLSLASHETSKNEDLVIQKNIRVFSLNKPLIQARLQGMLQFIARPKQAIVTPDYRPLKTEEPRPVQCQVPQYSLDRSGKILVAEDNTINQRILAMQLKKLGCNNFEIVSDGHELVEAFKKSLECGDHIAIIFTDQMMPGLNGFHAASRIRQLERDGAVCSKSQIQIRCPIVALTADAKSDAQIRAKEAGIDECLTKPVSIQDLDCMLKKWARIPVAASL